MPLIDDLKFKVDLMYKKLDRIHQAAVELEKNPNDKKKQNLLRAATVNLDDQFSEFDEAVNKLASIYSKQAPPIEEDLQKKFADYETLFYNVKAIVMTNLPTSTSATPRLSLNTSGGGDCGLAGMSLPKMQLPVFDGSILEFQSFMDIFLNSVHYTDLPDVRKFTYLKSALSGEALAVVSSLPTTATNYKIAWDSLVARYHDTNRLTNAYMEVLFDFPIVTRDAKSLRKFSSVIEQNLGALKALEHPTDSWSIPLMFLFKRKLTAQLREKWEIHSLNLVLPASIKDFIRFLDNEVHVLESSKNVHPTIEKLHKPFPNKNKGTTSFVTSAGDGKLCPCGKSHSLEKCYKFLNMSASARLRFVKSKQLCVCCFGSHFLRDCSSQTNCELCNSPHHAQLCFKRYSELKSKSKPGSNPIPNSNIVPNSNNASVAPSGGTESSNSVQSYQISASSANSTVMLATACAIAVGRDGTEHTVRILIDSASQASFITSATVERLRLRYECYRTPIFGFGQSAAGFSKGIVEVKIRPRQSHVKLTVQALVVEHIAQCPRLSASTISWPHINGLVLADPQFHTDLEIDILLGAEWYAHIVSGAPILGPEGAPDLLDTVFGYCLLGRVACEEDTSVHVMCTTCEFNIDRLIRAFWEIEEAPKKKLWSKEEQECEEFFLKTVSRQEDGRFIVRLPFRQFDFDLGDSYALARKRFHYLENRLQKNPVLRQHYNEFIADYISQGHMIVALSPPRENSYYIPHHCIYRKDEKLSRFRVVFDCSMKTTSGLSLNDVMHTGPTLQRNICDVLFRFRLHTCCMVADIRQMYRNIKMSELDFDYQRIFWRFSPTDPLLEYNLTTVLYGNAAAPYLALRSVAKLVEDDGADYPHASKVIMENTFVDDMCMSVPTVGEALILQKDLTELLGNGKFELRKWLSNRVEILENIPEAHRAMNKDVFSFRDQEGNDPGTAILGLAWNPVSDCFSFRIQPSGTIKITKRIIFSQIARLYDPLGFLSPVTMYGKYIMQHLWTQGLEWDETPSDDIVTKWVQYKNEIPLLSQFSIPRYTNLDNALDVQLHGFSDASERGFAAMVFLRTIDQNNQISISLLVAKSKVSPLKRESLPRLELCGAVLVSDLLDFSRRLLEGHCSLNSITAWCDSMVTLQWVKASPHKWKTYVANRTSYIHDRVSPSNFRHVPGEINPSDIASRGALPQRFLEDPYWKHGPDWLRKDPSCWPKTPEIFEGLDEVNAAARIVTLPVRISSRPNDEWITDFSSYSKLRRITAYWLRYIQYLRDPKNNKFSINGPTTDELRQATIRLVFIVQQRAFQSEIKYLNTEKPVPSKLRKLNPFIDSNSVIRVGGRLEKSKTISEDRKHPLLLPKDHHLTQIIIDHVHRSYFHAGQMQVHSIIQAEFWIMNAREVIRNRLAMCTTCFRAKPKEKQHLMGELPAARLDPVSAFNRCSVDYAGPVLMTMGRIRNAKVYKAYICIFVCFSTKAIHLELVSDLTTDAFIAALRRFIARRGTVREIHSDSGTNFVGAKRKLAQWYEVTGTKRYNEKVARELSDKGISWKLNAPGSPHMNGLVEAGVKTIKKHLVRVVGEQKFTFEEYYTILTQIEAVVNSRPITPVSSDPNDLQALTPGHFLMQQPAYVLPDPEHQEMNISHRWKLLQQLLNSFWTRWHREYLGTLQMRAKWTKKFVNLEIGDLVLLKEPNLPPTRWRLARVIRIYPGTDGTVRVAEVKTSQGTYNRTVRKLCPLPKQN